MAEKTYRIKASRKELDNADNCKLPTIMPDACDDCYWHAYCHRQLSFEDWERRKRMNQDRAHSRRLARNLEIIYENEHDFRKKDVEKAINRSQGYISRLRKGTTTAQIGLDDAAKISEIINERYGISMMQLFFSNLEDHYEERIRKTLEGKNGTA